MLVRLVVQETVVTMEMMESDDANDVNYALVLGCMRATPGIIKYSW